MKRYIITAVLMKLSMVVFGQEASIDEVLKRLNKNTVPYIHVNEITNREHMIFLDAREKNEYEVSKIAGAYHVGYSNFNIDLVKQLIPDKHKKIVVYCSIGVRSENIGSLLKAGGYNNVYNLWGGIFEWKNEGRSVVDAHNTTTEKVHAYSKKWGVYLKKGKKVY